MKRVYLVLDGNYLCWRTFFTTGRLAHGVVFGLLKSVQKLTDQHATPHVVFCFDHGENLRTKIDARYKSGRRAKVLSDDEAEQIAEMRRQVELLKTKVLKDCGFKDVFYQPGYEADDVCAAVVESLRLRGDDSVVASADHDLFQLLDDGIWLYDPHRDSCWSHQRFYKEWGLAPGRWREVKAIAGCATDDVRGVPGVGEKTAAKFLRGQLAAGSAKYAAIQEFLDTEEYQKNLTLVSLPLDGVQTFTPGDSVVDAKGWNRVAERFGMKSLAGKAPGHRGVGFGIRPGG